MRGNETPGRIVTNFCTDVGVGPRRNHLCELSWLQITGFGRGGGHILGFSSDFRRRRYNTLALPCECVMKLLRFFVLIFVVFLPDFICFVSQWHRVIQISSKLWMFLILYPSPHKIRTFTVRLAVTTNTEEKVLR